MKKYKINRTYQEENFQRIIHSEEFAKKCSDSVKLFHQNNPGFQSKFVKESYKKLFEEIDSIKNIYNKDETRNLLLEDNYYEKFKGKLKNRTLIKENIKLYKSIYEHTKLFEEYPKSVNNFYARIIFITKYNYDLSSIQCEKCKRISYNRKDDFIKECYSCNRWPTKKYFKIKYKDKWEEEFAKYVNNSCMPHLYAHNQPVSKISQELFNRIYNKINDKKDIYFYNLNKEYKIFLKKYEREILKVNCIFLDFKKNDKIIEFNGSYWHKDSSDYDMKRKSILESRGFKVLFIDEMEYYNNKDHTELKCLEFINE